MQLKLDEAETLRKYIKDYFSPYLIDQLQQAGMFENCLNCGHWDKTENHCGLYKLLPPPEIIVLGCPDHTNLIPF